VNITIVNGTSILIFVLYTQVFLKEWTFHQLILLNH